MTYAFTLRLAGACAFFLAFATPARADVIFTSGFEPGQGTLGFSISSSTSDAYAFIDTTRPSSGSQALQMQWFRMQNRPFSEEVTAATDFPDVLNLVSLASARAITYSVDVRIDGPAGGSSNVQAGLGLFLDDGNRIYLAGDGRVYGDYGRLDGGLVGLGAYHRLSMTYDRGSQTTFYSVDGRLIGSRYESEDSLDVFVQKISTQWYGGGDTPLYDPSQYTVLFDNFSVTTGDPIANAPEPGSLVLASLGAIVGVAGHRWRRWRGRPVAHS